jgi:branched-chain amino acid transport system substrate-binding protein
MSGRKTLAGLVAVVLLAASGCSMAPSEPTLIVGVDLPFQGSSKDSSDDTLNAMNLYLDRVGGKAGGFRITLKKYDDSTAAKGTWDDATCVKNAADHVANADEVAVMGTFNSGCAKLEAPVLNQAPDGPMLMVSDANTNPGLTKPWDTGEPQKYFPTGQRSYARVVTTDDIQGPAAADFAALDLGLKKVFVLNDGETYGQGVAKAFAGQATKDGMAVVGTAGWLKSDPNYTTLMERIRSTGADLVFLGGNFDNNGGQLIKDKVAVLGPNNGAVKLMGPDGFTGFPELLALTESEGTYLSFAGLSAEALMATDGVPTRFLYDYKNKYGANPRSPYALYGVQALQVILAAIEKSDGTRKGVRDQVFTGGGISIVRGRAMVGKSITIDPLTGDVSAEDITIEIVRDKTESILKSQSVTS